MCFLPLKLSCNRSGTIPGLTFCPGGRRMSTGLCQLGERFAWKSKHTHTLPTNRGLPTFLLQGGNGGFPNPPKAWAGRAATFLGQA